MILKIMLWIFSSFAFCVGCHRIFIYINSIYTYKKVKYLGVIENQKYQEIIDELQKNEILQKKQCLIQKNPKIKSESDDGLSKEMIDMKNSLIEIMQNS